ncbi:hypothetical protein ANANG_G00312960, partial [Anguilla anguilla]
VAVAPLVQQHLSLALQEAVRVVPGGDGAEGGFSGARGISQDGQELPRPQGVPQRGGHSEDGPPRSSSARAAGHGTRPQAIAVSLPHRKWTILGTLLSTRASSPWSRRRWRCSETCLSSPALRDSAPLLSPPAQQTPAPSLRPTYRPGTTRRSLACRSYRRRLRKHREEEE